MYSLLMYSLVNSRWSEMTVIPAAKMATDALIRDGYAHNAAEFAIFCAIYLILSVILAGILHFAVEKPFLRLRDTRF